MLCQFKWIWKKVFSFTFSNLNINYFQWFWQGFGPSSHGPRLPSVPSAGGGCSRLKSNITSLTLSYKFLWLGALLSQHQLKGIKCKSERIWHWVWEYKRWRKCFSMDLLGNCFETPNILYHHISLPISCHILTIYMYEFSEMLCLNKQMWLYLIKYAQIWIHFQNGILEIGNAG